MTLRDHGLWPGGAACEMEPAILAAYRPVREPATALGEDDDLKIHLAGCESCRRAVRVSQALSILAAEGPGFRLPDPHHVLWRSRVLSRFAEREAATERAARPLRWVQTAAVFLFGLLAAVTGAALWQSLTRTGGANAPDGGFDVSWLGSSTTLESAMSGEVLQVAIWLGIALLVGALGLAAHAVFQEG